MWKSCPGCTDRHRLIYGQTGKSAHTLGSLHILLLYMYKDSPSVGSSTIYYDYGQLKKYDIGSLIPRSPLQIDLSCLFAFSPIKTLTPCTLETASDPFLNLLFVPCFLAEKFLTRTYHNVSLSQTHESRLSGSNKRTRTNNWLTT